MNFYLCNIKSLITLFFFLSVGEKLLFAKGAESSILPKCIGGEIEKTRIHVDEFALVSANFYDLKNSKRYIYERFQTLFLIIYQKLWKFCSCVTLYVGSTFLL